MKELHTLETSDLMDMLSKQTVDFTKMLADGNLNGEYEKCKLAIKALQAEIELRKKVDSNSNQQTDITTAPDFS